MLKNLTELLGRADELGARAKELEKRLAGIRGEKEHEFEAAAPSDDSAFQRISALGAQEGLATARLEKLARERAGLGVALLNEANHARAAVAKSARARRAKILAQIDNGLSKHIPDGKLRARLVEQAARVAPEARRLEKAALLSSHIFNPRSTDEFAYARGVLNAAARAIADCGL